MSTDFFEAIEEQLIAATEQGVPRGRWRRRRLFRLRVRVPWRAPTFGIVAGIGAALTASAIAATLTLPASHPKARVASSVGRNHSFVTAGSVPAGFQPQSFTAVSEYNWWLLGTAPCGGSGGGHLCTAIVRTTDGGPSFSRIPAPPVPATAVSNLRFASPQVGYAFGPQLWSTHDGGQRWTRIRLGRQVQDLAISDGYVYAIVDTHGRGRLMRSSVGADHWSVLGTAGSGPLSGLWVQGPTVIVQAGTAMLVSNSFGAGFGRVPGVQNAGDCNYDEVITTGPGIWAVCMAGMAPDEILLSLDGGHTFRTAASIPDGPINAFAAASTSVAVASGQGPLFRTADAGATWTRVRAPSASWIYLGFTDSTHGVALGAFGTAAHRHSRLYYTTDGGASYHLVPIGS